MKVTIETHDGGGLYEIKLEVGGETHSQMWKLTSTGSRMVGGIEWEDAPVSDEVYEAMESISSAAYDLAKEMSRVYPCKRVTN